MKPKRSKEDTFVITLYIVLAVLVLGFVLLGILATEAGFGAGFRFGMGAGQPSPRLISSTKTQNAEAVLCVLSLTDS